MHVKLTFSDEARAMIQRHKTLGERIARAAARAVIDTAIAIRGYISEDLLSGEVLNVRTGSLRKSIDHEIVTDPDRITGEVVVREGPASKYAGIQEEGGTIVPKNAKALAVPLPAALTARGVLKGKYNAANLRELDLVLIKNKKSGKALLAEVVEGRRKNRLRYLFVLKPSVTIEGQHYMAKGFLLMESMLPSELRRNLSAIAEVA